MKKTLDTTGIANELKGASVFFAQTPPQQPIDTRRSSKTPSLPESVATEDLAEKVNPVPVQVLRTHEPTNDGTKEPSTGRTVERTHERPVAQPVSRTKVRHTFDVFADQVTSLKRVLLTREETFQKRYRLGDLVQEALDMLITKERNNE